MDGLGYSGIPLGGLGTGSVELRRDGYLHEWQIMNNRPWGSGPEAPIPADAAWFGMQIQRPGDHRSVILGTAPAHHGHNLMAAWNDPYVMPWIEYADAIEAQTRFPFTRLAYRFPDLPVEVQLEAFSPFIPLDEKHSGLPLAYFTFSLRNPSADTLRLTLFGALRNLVGYSQNQLSTITLQTGADGDSLEFGRETLAPEATDSGSLVLGIAGHPGTTTHLLHGRTRDIWEPLRETGRLDDADLGSFVGEVGNVGATQRLQARAGLPVGLLGQTLELPAQASATVTFVLAWHFPHHVERPYPEKNCVGGNIGHRYAEWFDRAADVFHYGVAHQADLRARTGAFADAYYDGTSPPWLLEAVAAQFSTLIKASWWDRAGRFGIWEGLGCCGLQTTDITYYGSFPIVQFFPAIQQSQMRLTRNNIELRGKIPHMMPGHFGCCDADHRGRVDLIPQFILLIWRDTRWTGDLDYLREMWPTILEGVEFFRTLDTDGDGLPNNHGPDQTYDQFPLKGTSAFVGFLTAASLRALAEMAQWLGESRRSAAYRDELTRVLATLQQQLWNGRYFRLCYDQATRTANEGVMADQLNGDWFVRQTSGRGLVPDEQVHSALQAVLDACSNPRGFLSNCTWPDGAGVRIGRHTANQAEWPWSGVEYAVAAHLALIGREQDSLKVARDVWDRYERAGLRFNHIECGGHYYRALSAWAVYLALHGFALDCHQHALSLRLPPGDTRFVLTTPACWATVRSSSPARRLEIVIGDGALTLQSLRLTPAITKRVAVQQDGQALPATLCDGAITFPAPLTLGPASRLVVQW